MKTTRSAGLVEILTDDGFTYTGIRTTARAPHRWVVTRTAPGGKSEPMRTQFDAADVIDLARAHEPQQRGLFAAARPLP